MANWIGNDAVRKSRAVKGAETEPITVSISDAQNLLSVGRSTVFKLLKSGELSSFRCGRRRLIVLNSIREYVESRARCCD
ncbi:helix-turn-helix domain-containing protein [Paraurantiacibacter namhicola]|uniref:helix-turn-helix domain-containing protein n=1 Tax=Paraurantiacibacter namhicola TaxID=645517 RepID=UPI0012EEA8B9